MVFESVLNVAEEFENVDPVDARVQQGVHALEGRLAKVQAVVNLVLEGSHLNLKIKQNVSTWRNNALDSRLLKWRLKYRKRGLELSIRLIRRARRIALNLKNNASTTFISQQKIQK